MPYSVLRIISLDKVLIIIIWILSVVLSSTLLASIFVQPSLVPSVICVPLVFKEDFKLLINPFSVMFYIALHLLCIGVVSLCEVKSFVCHLKKNRFRSDHERAMSIMKSDNKQCGEQKQIDVTKRHDAPKHSDRSNHHQSERNHFNHLRTCYRLNLISWMTLLCIVCVSVARVDIPDVIQVMFLVMAPCVTVLHPVLYLYSIVTTTRRNKHRHMLIQRLTAILRSKGRG